MLQLVVLPRKDTIDESNRSFTFHYLELQQKRIITANALAKKYVIFHFYY